MKSIFNFIIETDNRYNNTIDVDGKELVVNSEITERDAIFVNRTGRVLAVPILDYSGPIAVGEEVIVHHNVFRRWYNTRQKESNGGGYLSETQFSVYHDQVFAYKRNGVWRSTPNYCFVTPVTEDHYWDGLQEVPLQGDLYISNEDIPLSLGTRVGFTPDSEYEFEIDGQKCYRILSNQITIDYGNKKKTTGAIEGSGKCIQPTG